MSIQRSEVVLLDTNIPEYKSDKYPRQKPNEATVARYVEAIKSGEQLPPIEIEQDTNHILDGYHRHRAHLECGLEQIECIVVHLNGIPPRLYAASMNTRHGLSLSNAEKEEIACYTVENTPDITNIEIAQALGVQPATVGGWVKNLRAAQTQERDTMILWLSLLGWTQEEIGDKVDLERSVVAKVCKNYESEFMHTFQSLLSQGHSLEVIAERTGLPVKLVLALSLKDKDDQATMDSLKIGIKPYNVWNFSECDPRFGSDHPGRIPGQLIAQTLYFFTEPGDLVIDPMVGSGTTLDVCLAMGRRCYGYDIDDHHERFDVIPHNILEGWPERIKKADLIFWDPPYYKKKDSEYVEGGISKLSYQDYMLFFENSFKSAHQQVKKKTRLALLMGDWEGEDNIHIWDYAYLLQKTGWKIKTRIQAPLSTQQVHPHIMKHFKDDKRLTLISRDLIVVEA